VANLQRVAQYGSRMEAEGARSALAADGIEAILSGGDLGGANPVLAPTFGVDLLVDVEDLARARELLAAFERPATGRSGRTPAFDTPGLALARRLIGASWVGFGLLVVIAGLQLDASSTVVTTAIVVTGSLAPVATIAYAVARGKARRQAYARSEDGP
jgi:hypothetical protein